MDFAQLLVALMEFLMANLLNPISELLTQFGSSITNLDDLVINFGFSELTWFSISAYDLSLVIIGFMVSITALVLTWKFIKFLNGFLKGLFTGIKR